MMVARQTTSVLPFNKVHLHRKPHYKERITSRQLSHTGRTRPSSLVRIASFAALHSADHFAICSQHLYKMPPHSESSNRGTHAFSRLCLDSLKAAWTEALTSAQNHEQGISQEEAKSLQTAFLRRRGDVASDIKGILSRKSSHVDLNLFYPDCVAYTYSRDGENFPNITLTFVVSNLADGSEACKKVFTVRPKDAKGKVVDACSYRDTTILSAGILSGKDRSGGDIETPSKAKTAGRQEPQNPSGFDKTTRAALNELIDAMAKATFDDIEQEDRYLWGQVLVENADTLASDILTEADKHGFTIDERTAMTLYPDTDRPNQISKNGILFYLKPLLSNTGASSVQL